jgi:zinc D-Ala-D-Ala carboxypeptidase
MLANPSEHLTWKELACKDGTLYPNDFILDGRVYKLAHTFENIRKLCGNQSLIIHSAYRSPKYNKKVGGASHSQHLFGKALDIEPTKFSVDTFHKIIFQHAIALGIGGLGHYPTFIHIDIRDVPKLVVW